ncbi:hypothetical protein D3C86_1176870 [compost metagenome]
MSTSRRLGDRKPELAASSIFSPGCAASRPGRAGARTAPPKPSEALIRTVPAIRSGRVTRSAASMALSASSAVSSSCAPAAVSSRPEAERTTRVDFSAVSSRATRRPTVAASMPSRWAAVASEPARAAAMKMRTSSQSNIAGMHSIGCKIAMGGALLVC